MTLYILILKNHEWSSNSVSGCKVNSLFHFLYSFFHVSRIAFLFLLKDGTSIVIIFHASGCVSFIFGSQILMCFVDTDVGVVHAIEP